MPEMIIIERWRCERGHMHTSLALAEQCDARSRQAADREGSRAERIKHRAADLGVRRIERAFEAAIACLDHPTISAAAASLGIRPGGLRYRLGRCWATRRMMLAPGLASTSRCWRARASEVRPALDALRQLCLDRTESRESPRWVT